MRIQILILGFKGLNSLLALERQSSLFAPRRQRRLQERLSYETFLVAKKGEKRLYSQGKAITS